MDDLTKFKVNDDGSVTVANEPNKDEANILDIFRIEKAKGGPFASRRMKLRALKYAKRANIPKLIVEKLMLSNHPDDFANYQRTSRLIVWLYLIVLFLGGAVIFAWATCWKSDVYPMLLWMMGSIACLGCSYICIRQYRRLRKSIVYKQDKTV